MSKTVTVRQIEPGVCVVCLNNQNAPSISDRDLFAIVDGNQHARIRCQEHLAGAIVVSLASDVYPCCGAATWGDHRANIERGRCSATWLRFHLHGEGA